MLDINVSAKVQTGIPLGKGMVKLRLLLSFLTTSISGFVVAVSCDRAESREITSFRHKNLNPEIIINCRHLKRTHSFTNCVTALDFAVLMSVPVVKSICL